jgi:hypothetical protein
MRKVGNVVSNRIYNPEGKRAPVPIDVDEVDSAMERFIRQKYMNNVASKPSTSGAGQPRSPRSDEGVPPPLPPKNSTTSKFNLRSATSLFPLSSRSKKDKALPSPRRPSSHDSGSKAAQQFGAALNYGGHEEEKDLDKKLARLRDMGFQDQQRNTIVLRGVNGNLERAIESLVRLGEGDGHSPAPARDSSLRATRSMTPLSTEGLGLGAGASVQKPARDLPPTPSSSSTNPFDSLVQAQPQTAQSTGNLQSHPGNQSLNPFNMARQQTDPLIGGFQTLNINTSQQQQQPLFPNRTGGLTTQAHGLPAFSQPTMPSAPTSPLAFPQHLNPQGMTYPQSQVQPQQTGYNPFFANQGSPTQQQQQQPQPQLTLNMAASQRPFANNPFVRSPTRIASPTSLGQIPEQSQPTFQTSSPAVASTNPFFSSPAQTPTYGVQPGFPQVPQQQQYFQSQRHDKASIMALYGSMHAAPQTQSQPTSPLVTQPTQQFGQLGYQDTQTTQQPQVLHQSPVTPARSMTQPLPQSSSNNNPFTNGTAAAPSASADPFPTTRHISRESVNFGMEMAWTNGRHSPDAFASLSARHS